MFTSRTTEAPAAGSAPAALTALIADLRGADGRLRVCQGEDIRRPSTLLTRTVRDGEEIRAHVGGLCATMVTGSFAVT
jgi:trans-2,3-dihydro-3-hydroxyanthranilate isomerase